MEAIINTHVGRGSADFYMKECKVDRIMDIFQSYRMEPTPLDQYDSIGKALLRNRISAAVHTNNPIRFVMLGFPFKSSNKRDKVLGDIPDMAERVTLENFDNFFKDVSSVYSGGVQFNIISDGYVFNDLLKIEDTTVEKYVDMNINMSSTAIKFYTLKDFYKGYVLNDKRNRLINDFGITAEELQKQTLFNKNINYLYTGMFRFMEEELSINPFPSKNSLTKAAKLLTREMMLRNEAYSNLVSSEFSDMIRLSMHKSINDGQKYSFKLIPGKDTIHSAWHCALLINNDSTYSTIHKREGVEKGYELVYINNEPSHFVAA